MNAAEALVLTVHTTQIGMNMREGAKKIVGFQMETTKQTATLSIYSLGLIYDETF